MSTISVGDVIEAGRRASLTSTVLAQWAQKGTPKQREYLHGLLQAEHESRQESRRLRLLRSARLPALKSLSGFDYSAIRFPDDYGREALTSLEFIDHAHDLVLYGDVGRACQVFCVRDRFLHFDFFGQRWGLMRSG